MGEAFLSLLVGYLAVWGSLFAETDYFFGGAQRLVNRLILPTIEQRLSASAWAAHPSFASADQSRQSGPRLATIEPAPSLEATSALAVDFASGQVLFEQAADKVQPIASITKLMTALVFLDHNPGWDKTYLVVEADKREGGKINFFAGDEVKVRDLFMAMLVASDNAAVIGLVRSTGFSEAEFVRLMNEKAESLGLRQTAFRDPTGLHNGNVSSAREVALLAKAALAKPEIQEAVLADDYRFITGAGTKRQLDNTDKLLAGRGQELRIYGGKTGYLVQAGYCFVGRFGKQNKDIVATVLGTATPGARFAETKRLVNWVFDNYIWSE